MTPTGTLLVSLTLTLASQQAPASGTATNQPGRSIQSILRAAGQAIQSTTDASMRAYALIEIARAQVRTGDKDGAAQSCRQAAGAASTLQGEAQAGVLLSVACTRAQAGDRAGALNELRRVGRLTEDLKSERSGIQAMGRMARCQSDFGAADAARATLQSMRAIALATEPIGNNRVGPFSDLVAAQAYCGDYDEAFETVETLGACDHFLQGQLYGALASGVMSDRPFYNAPRKTVDEPGRKTRHALLERVLEGVERLELAEEKPYFYLPIFFAKLGDFDTALRVARRYGKDPIKAPQCIDLTAEPQIFAAIARLQYKAGLKMEARATLAEARALYDKLAARMHGDFRLPGRLVAIASVQAQTGDFAGALTTLESTDVDTRVQFPLEVADEQEAAGDRAGAAQTLRRALPHAERRLRTLHVGDTSAEDSSELARYAKVQAKVGDIRAALATFDRIKSESYKGSVAGDVAEARASAGDTAVALRWALSLEPESVRARALLGLAQGIARP